MRDARRDRGCPTVERVDTRIGTFNLLHGIPVVGATAQATRPTGPPEPDLDLLRSSAAALDADVLGIQEVDRHQVRSGFADQTAAVAEALGAAHWRFAPAVHGTPGETKDWSAATADDGADTEGPTYGVGLVSRLPVLDWQVRRFAPAPFSIPLLIPAQPRPRLVRIPDEPRLALAAVIDGPAGPFTVVTAHLSFVPGYNVRQLRALARWARSLPGPVFIAGDFNLPGGIPRRVTGWESLAKGATYPSFKPRVQFDHVLAHGLATAAPRRATVHPLAVSDHCALTVDVGLG